MLSVFFMFIILICLTTIFISIKGILFKRRCFVIKEQQINEQIRDKEVRLIGPDGEQMGIMHPKEALVLAQENFLDLVKIAPKAKPPVCKIMDYGKYKYQLSKKEKDARKKQKTISVKEIRLRPAIEDHDLNTKANHGKKFLKSGDKVKISIRFRGRELGHKNMGYEIMDKFFNLLEDLGEPVGKPKFEGNSLVLVVEPAKNK